MSFDALSWSALPRLGVFLLIGGLGGALYFYAVWRSAGALVGGAGVGRTLVAILGRFLALAALLLLASQFGAAALLAGAAGVMIGRAIMLGRLKEAVR